jgi:uncharacterized protein involved in outer membrane biogenesis
MDATTTSASRRSTWTKRIGIGLAALIIAIALVIAFFPWNALRGPLAHYLSDKTGREIAIHGDVTVKLAWHPWIDLREVSIGNASWSEYPVMAYADRIGLRIVPLSYFTRLRIPELELETPLALLEKNANGDANWTFGDDHSAAANPPLIGRIRVIDGQMRFRDPGLKADVRIALTTVSHRGAQSLAFSGGGTLRGEKLRIAGMGDGLGALRDVDAPFHVALNAKSGATELWFDGSIVPDAPDNVRGFVKVVGTDMSRLYPLLPAPIPWTPPYALQGRVAHFADRWTLTALRGKVGQSDVAGTMTVFNNLPRRKLVGDITSQRLDYRDLGGFVGFPPGKSETTARAASQKASARKLAAEDRVFSTDRLSLDKLRDYDADFHFRGKNVGVDRVPMDNVEFHIKLADGKLRYDPVNIGIAKGRVTMVGELDATRAQPHFAARIEGRNLDLAEIFPELASPRGRTGRFGGYVDVKADGDSIAKLAGSSNGEGALIMAGGEASALALLLTNIDLANAVPLVLGGDKTAALRCAVTTFAIDKGHVVPNVFTVDTSAVRIEGDGSIDLGDEQYDLTLHSKSKKFSVFALRGPIHIGGSLRNPDVRPEAAPIAARVGVAAGLAVIAPPLAILPFIDLGDAKDADCAALADSGAKKPAVAPKPDSAQRQRGNERAS